MKAELLCFALMFLGASAASTLDSHAQILEEIPHRALANSQVVIASSGSDDERNMGAGKAPMSESLPSRVNKFAEADIRAAVKSVLLENPELVLEALKIQQIELVNLIEQATYLRQAEAKKAQRLEELKQPKVPVIDADRPIRGNPHAPITIVEYSDFECPFCRSAASTVTQILKQYGDDVRLVYKHNPLDFHPMAEPAARYFEAIAIQDAEEAWRFHDHVFEQQDLLADGESVLKAIVATLNVDAGKVERDLSGEAIDGHLGLDRDEAVRFGFDGTPAFLINGVSLMGSVPKEEFEEVIRMFMNESREVGHVEAEHK
ncbi:MAG: DsbA family protein [Nitrospirales bacterium]